MKKKTKTKSRQPPPSVEEAFNLELRPPYVTEGTAVLDKNNTPVAVGSSEGAARRIVAALNEYCVRRMPRKQKEE